MIHLYRSIDFYNSLQEGNILPSWAGNLNATYGYPLFIFNYPLPYYLVSFFHALGFTFISSLKLFLASNFILSGIFMYFFAKKIFNNDLAAFTSAIFYQFAPYHLIDLHFKVVIGEILFFTILPFAFFAFHKLWKEKNTLWLSLSILSITALIMSHVVIALFTLALLLSYATLLSFQSKTKLPLLTTILATIIGSFATSYIWATPFFLSKYTIFKKVAEFYYSPHIFELLYSPWRWGFLFQGPEGQISFLLGYTHIFISVLIILLLIRNKIQKSMRMQIVFFLLALFISLFLATSFSRFFWGAVPFLKAVGSHRLLLLSTFIISILSGYLVLHFKGRRRMIYLLIFITICTTILNWGQRRLISDINDQYLITNLWKSTSQSEGHYYANSILRDPKKPWFSKLPIKHIEILNGKGEIKEFTRNSTNHRYIVNAETELLLRENTLYFPGWDIFIDNKKSTISHDSEGVISFSVRKGLHFTEVKYNNPAVYKLLKTVSIIFLLVIISNILISFANKQGNILIRKYEEK